MPSTDQAPSLPGDLAAQQEIAEFLARSGIRPIEARGRVLGPAPGYQLLERIGEGGMGTVYRARDLALERDVAVKLIKRSHRNHRLLAERLAREAKLLASLDHDNVIAIHAVGESETGEPFVVMPLVRGSNLGEWVAQREPTAAERLELALAAGRGLQAVHEAGLIHRDFKPANVLVQDQPGARPRVFVSDFGLARALELETEPPTFDSGSGVGEAGVRTETASRESGTTRYMAPELFRGQPATRASDQYAYCVALWELLLGHGSVPEYGWVGAPPRPEGLSASIYAALARGLSPEPSERWPELSSLLDALTPRAPAAISVSRWRGLAIALGLALGLGGMGLGVQALRAEDAGAVSVCADAGEVDALWSPAQRAQLAAHLRTVAPEPADEDLIRSTLASLDAAAESWGARQREQCQREWLLGGLHDSCGQLWQRRFTRQVALLGAIEAEQLDHVPELLRSLTRGGCSQLQSPLDFEVAERIDRSRDAVTLGDFELAEQLADQARQIGEGIGSCGAGWGHERAAAHFQLGLVHAKAGRPRAALVELTEAETHATACGDAALERRIHLRAAKVHALQLSDAEAANTALGRARANANVVGNELPEDAFEAHSVEAAIALLAADYETARERYASALEVIALVDPLRAAEARLNLGTMVMLLGQADMAAIHWERGMAELESRLGPERARNKRAVQAANLGELAFGLGHHERAALHFEQAARSSRAVTRLVGFNGQLRLALAQVYGEQDFAAGVELSEHLAAEVEGAEDLPRERLATHLFLRGRLRLAASYDGAFMTGDPSRRDAVLDAGLADLERSLELWTTLPEQEARYDCMLYLAWHLHDDARTPADQDARDQRARTLLAEVLANYDEKSEFMPTARSLELALKKTDARRN